MPLADACIPPERENQVAGWGHQHLASPKMSGCRTTVQGAGSSNPPPPGSLLGATATTWACRSQGAVGLPALRVETFSSTPPTPNSFSNAGEGKCCSLGSDPSTTPGDSKDWGRAPSHKCNANVSPPSRGKTQISALASHVRSMGRHQFSPYPYSTEPEPGETA